MQLKEHLLLLTTIVILYCLANTASATETEPATAATTAISSAETQPPSQAEDAAADTVVDTTPMPPLIAPAVAPRYEPAVTDPVEKGAIKEPEQPPLNATSAATAAPEQPKSWTETHPVQVNADWLQITTGEWLRGHIIAMQKESIDFDSDELDLITLDWDKVKYIKSADPYSLRFDDDVFAVGMIEVTTDKVFVSNDYDNQTFERKNLLTIASGKETELSYWKVKVSLNLNIRRGNTEQTDYGSIISAKRRTTDSRLTLDYNGNFTTVEGTETVNNNRLNLAYSIFITRYLFWTPIFSEYYSDPFQNIDQRISAGVGLGYSLIDRADTSWDISGGPSYQETRYVSVQPGNSTIDHALTLMLSTYFEKEINSMVDVEATYSPTLGDSKIGNYSHHSMLTVETELTNHLDFDVSFVWDMVRQPVPEQDGTVPDKNDFRITIGLGYDL